MSRLGFTEADLASIDVYTMLSQVGGYYRYELSEIDSLMWSRAITLYGDMPVKRFLVHHMENADPKHDFFPRIAAFFKFIDPGANNAIAAFEELREQVARCGPWCNPVFRSHAIVRTVQALGGWVQVNKELPSPEADRFGYEAFYKRFEAAYSVACSEMALHHGAQSERLLGLHSVMALEHAQGSPAAAGLLSHDLDAQGRRAKRGEAQR